MKGSFVETVARRGDCLCRGFQPFVAHQTIENNSHLHTESWGTDLQAAVNCRKQTATDDTVHIQRNCDETGSMHRLSMKIVARTGICLLLNLGTQLEDEGSIVREICAVSIVK
jgi:hypothetical protein